MKSNLTKGCLCINDLPSILLKTLKRAASRRLTFTRLPFLSNLLHYTGTALRLLRPDMNYYRLTNGSLDDPGSAITGTPATPLRGPLLTALRLASGPSACFIVQSKTYII